MSRLRFQLLSCLSTLCPEFEQPGLCCAAHSPHIKAITERITIDGAHVCEEEFAGLAAQDSSVMQEALQGAFGSLSHFEVLTSLAFKHFQRKQVIQSPTALYLCLCFSHHVAVSSLQSGKSLPPLALCAFLCKAKRLHSPDVSLTGDQILKVTGSQLQDTVTGPVHAEQTATCIAASGFVTRQLSSLPIRLSPLPVQVQLAVIEAGLGGVADATNVFEPAQLACAVITAIDNDHMRALGESQQVLLNSGHHLCLVACQIMRTHIAENMSSTTGGALALPLRSAIPRCSRDNCTQCWFWLQAVSVLLKATRTHACTHIVQGSSPLGSVIRSLVKVPES